ncbi:MAG: ATP-binding cassette domain-containing protein [Alphaproteobacteria bacterium]|nr:ATP-binding cassette domain-containing protein [Alphaproteobacteria bacterium]
MLEITTLTHAYAGRTVLALDAWQVAAGEHWLLLGPSGSGKSTLLHIVAGLLRPSGGSVRLAGTDLYALPAGERDRRRGRSVGIVFQRLHLLEALSVLQNLALAQSLAGQPVDRRHLADLLSRLGLSERAAAKPAALSRGEAQRVALARALVNRPQLLLADEPTSSLDDDNADRALDLLTGEAKAVGAALIVATHDARAAARFVRHLTLPKAT